MSFGGLFGNAIATGESFLPLITDEETLFRVLDAAIEFFDQNAVSGERFKFTIDRCGWDAFRTYIQEVAGIG